MGVVSFLVLFLFDYTLRGVLSVTNSVYDTLVWASLRERGVPEPDRRQRILMVTRCYDSDFYNKLHVKTLTDGGYEVTQTANTREAIADLVRRVGQVERYFGSIIFDGQGEPHQDMEEVFQDYIWEAMQR